MSSLLTAELAATCNALGSLDKITGKYLLDDYTLDTVKDLIRYLRRDDEDHEIRRHLGQTRVLETDLVPILICHWEQAELFDVTLRLIVNLTNPPLLLYREEIPTEKGGRRCYLQMISHLINYKLNAFTKTDIWTVLGKRLTQILEMDQLERGEDLGLIIERILILVRNILHVPADDNERNRPDNEASVHDQVLWALNQSGLLDIILYMSFENEKQYFMHIMEIVSLALKEQNPSSLADAALHRSAEEKIRDQQELCIIRENEKCEKNDKLKKILATRHSRFGGTFVVKNMKSISDNNLICHKPLSKVTSLDFDHNKSKVKPPKNKRPDDDFSHGERRSAFAVRLFLKEFCIEFLNGSYNPIMHYVRDNLIRSKTQKNDETYYMWAIKFFMEFNRKHDFQVKYISETMAVSTFHYVQQQMEKCFEMIIADKKTCSLWVKRLHLCLKAYQELLQTMLAMDKCADKTVRESSNVIKSNIFYVLEYREFILHMMITFDETRMPKAYLKDLIETAHLFLKLLEHFCKKHSLVVQKKIRSKSTKSKKKDTKSQKSAMKEVNKENQWQEVASQLSAVLQSDAVITTDILPFDATLETGIDEQKGDCMKKIQRLLLDFRFEDAIGLIRAAREVWPENDIFGASTMEPDEEFSIMRTIFMADIGAESIELAKRIEVEDNDEEEDEEEDDDDEGEGGVSHITEADFSFVDFFNRFVQPKVVKACCLLLANFEKNTVYTNHCVIKLMHRIAWDCKYSSMFFQASLFRTFQKILSSKLRQFEELRTFAIFIIRKFIEVAEKNSKAFMETLFWKTTRDAYDIENGYEGESHKSGKASSWSEEQENELRVLFMENQSSPATDKDVIDWIQENMIDQSKSRRAIIKKLKELGLIFKAPTRKSTHQAVKAAKERIPAEFTPEEDDVLMRLWPEVREIQDPMGTIIPQMPLKRSKKQIIERLLTLDLIHDKKECRKKRQKKKSGNDQNDSNSSNSSDANESDSDDPAPKKKTKKNNKNKFLPPKQKSKLSKKKIPKTPASSADVAKSLIAAVDGGFTEALKWIIESIEEVALDQEAEGFNPEAESIPILPIQEECVIAMENSTFQSALKCLGIDPPADEQETYWRIPGNIHFESLRKRCETVNKAIDKTLIIPEESHEMMSTPNEPARIESSSEEEMDDFFKRISNIGQTSIEPPVTLKTNTPPSSIKHKLSQKRKRLIDSIDSDSDDEKNRPTHVRRKKKLSSGSSNSNHSPRNSQDASKISTSDENSNSSNAIRSKRKRITKNLAKIDSSDSDNNKENSLKPKPSTRMISSDEEQDPVPLTPKGNRNNSKNVPTILSDTDENSDSNTLGLKKKNTTKKLNDVNSSGSENEEKSLSNNNATAAQMVISNEEDSTLTSKIYNTKNVPISLSEGDEDSNVLKIKSRKNKSKKTDFCADSEKENLSQSNIMTPMISSDDEQNYSTQNSSRKKRKAYVLTDSEESTNETPTKEDVEKTSADNLFDSLLVNVKNV